MKGKCQYCLIVFGVTVWLTVFAQSPPASIMQLQWKAHEGLDAKNRLKIVLPHRLYKAMGVSQRRLHVMGYLPYWMWGELDLHLDVVDIVAYFGVEARSDGTLGSPHDWGSKDFTKLANAVHDAGGKVVLTLVCFKSSTISAILNNTAVRSKIISAVVELVVRGNGDGVNIDFEGVLSQDKEKLVEFVKLLHSALAAEIPKPHISLATPAIDWRDAFDYDRLAQNASFLFIMGYDYHWPGGAPGPVSPLKGSARWGKYSLEFTVQDYLQWGGVHNSRKFILGLPLYGEDWPVKSLTVPAKSLGKASPVVWDAAQTESATYGRLWDAPSYTPYYQYTEEGTNHQVWYDDVDSFIPKARLALENNFGGVGVWALGYAQNDSKLWSELKRLVFEEIPSSSDDEGMDTSELAYEDIEAEGEIDQDSDISLADVLELSDRSNEMELAGEFQKEIAEQKIGERDIDITKRDRYSSLDMSPERRAESSGGCSGSSRPSSPVVLLLVLVVMLELRNAKDPVDD